MAGYLGSKAVLLSTTAAVITGDLTVDTNTLYVDSTNNRVGVGNTTPTTALDVTGTITSDGLALANGGDRTITGPLNNDLFINSRGNSAGEGTHIQSNGTTRLFVEDATGDISFYEDTGTTPKFHWDASAESLGIGTSSPSAKLHVDSGTLKVSGNGVDVVTSYSDVGIFGTSSNHDLALRTNNEERMRIDSSGDVGIGEVNPDMKLHIKDATNAYVKLEDSGGVLGGAASAGIRMFAGANEQGQIGFISTSLGNMRFNNLQGNVYIGADTNNAHSSSFIRFAVDDTEAARFNQNGDFLVGKTATDVGATGGTEIRSSGLVYISRSGATMVLNRTSGTGALVNISQAGSPVGSITVTASATAYNTSSDYRLKENVTPIQGAADVVMSMQPCTYTAKADGLWYDGFLAHELQEVHPRAVQGTKDAMMDEEYEITPAVEATYAEDGTVLTEAVPAVMGTRSVPDMQSVDYSKLTPILTAALQEALTEIAALKVRVAALEVTP